MRRSIRRLAVGLGVLALVTACAHSASADTWANTVEGPGGNDITINTTFANASGSSSVGTSGVQFSTTFYTSDSLSSPAGPAFRTFCVDLSSYLGNGGSGPFDVPVTVTSGTSTDRLGNTQNIGAAGWVVNTYENYTNAQFDTLGGVSGVTNAQANTALQMAVWEATYNGGTSVNNTGANLYFTGSGTDFSNEVSIANAILAARGSQVSAVGFIQYEAQNPNGYYYSQDMIFAIPAPEPSSLAIAGLGMLGFVGYGLRRKRS